MWKKQLRTFSILRRALPPTSTSTISVDSVWQNQFFSAFSSLRLLNREEQGPRNYQTPSCHFLANHKFSGNNFCSESAEKALARCWSCNAVAPTATSFLFCESCRSVQPSDHSVDYFQIFGLDEKYEIEGENLAGKYKDWQKKLHPDLVHSKSEKEREYAAEQSARVIDGYRTLTDPLSRAVYIMKLEGVDVDEEKTISDPELLAEIMETREAVEEAADAQTQEKLKHWSNTFANAFQSQKYEEALTSIQRMTYYKRVNEEIIKKL